MQERDTNLWVAPWRLGRASVRGGLIFIHRHRTEDLEEVRGFGGGTDLKQDAGIMYNKGRLLSYTFYLLAIKVQTISFKQIKGSRI